jgi:copper chaperone CopZ
MLPAGWAGATMVFTVHGMTCMENCGNTVRNRLQGMRGVQGVEVDQDLRTVRVFMDTDSAISAQECVDAIDLVGFDADITDAGVASSEYAPPLPIVR